MSTFSAVVNGQLVPVAPANAVVAPPAPNPVISNGAYASNLPGMSMMGGATNIPVPQASVSTNNTAAASGGVAAASGGTGSPTLSSFSGNVWSQPIWQNPLALTVFFLGVAYLVLRYVHWRA